MSLAAWRCLLHRRQQYWVGVLHAGALEVQMRTARRSTILLCLTANRCSFSSYLTAPLPIVGTCIQASAGAGDEARGRQRPEAVRA